MVQKNLGYAQALFELSITNKTVDEFLKQSKTLLAVLESHPELMPLLSSKALSKDEKKAFLIKVFGQDINHIFLTGLKLMIDHSKFSNLDKTLNELIHLIHEHQGVQEGVVYSTNKLSKEVLDKLQNKLSKTLNKKTKLINHINKELIGGLKVVVNNKVYDNSLLTQLKNLKSEMMKGK